MFSSLNKFSGHYDKTHRTEVISDTHQLHPFLLETETQVAKNISDLKYCLLRKTRHVKTVTVYQTNIISVKYEDATDLSGIPKKSVLWIDFLFMLLELQSRCDAGE